MNIPRETAHLLTMMTHSPTLSPVFSRAYLQDLQKFGIKLGLDNVRTLLASFHDPQRAFPSVHVAGTNGKGSVCAMLAEILTQSGFRVGLYTSPHLVRIEERIRVGGRMISERDLCRLLGLLKSRIEDLTASKTIEAPPTYFEVITTLAFLYFREKKVDIAVLEVGMGGRFDATNVVIPLVSVITTVAKDHMEHLGRTLARIAFEKAGIIKSGVPVVCGVDRGPALTVIRRRAAEENAPFVEVFSRDTSFKRRKSTRRSSFEYKIGGEAFRLEPGLRGVHQGRNAAVAVVTAGVLGGGWRPLKKRAIEDGIRSVVWEGRLEEIGRSPRVFLDGAHNEAGAVALSEFIQEACPRPPVLVFVMMKDKSLTRVSRILFPLAQKIILTKIPYPRAAGPEELRAKARPFAKKIIIEPDLRKALALARRSAGSAGTVFVTGSLFLVGEVKKNLLGR